MIWCSHCRRYVPHWERHRATLEHRARVVEGDRRYYDLEIARAAADGDHDAAAWDAENGPTAADYESAR